MSGPPSYDDDLLSRLNALKKSSISTLDQSKPQPSRQQQTPNPESDLSTRLRSLRNASATSSPSPASVYRPPPPTSPSKDFATFPSVAGLDTDPLRDPHSLNTDDKTLDELLAELGPDDQWSLNPDDPNDIQKLLNEAKTSLSEDQVTRSSESKSDHERDQKSKGKEPGNWDQNALTKGIDFSVFTSDDEGEEEPKKEGGEAKEKDSKSEDDEADDIVRRMLDELDLEKANEPPAPEKPSVQQSGNENEFSLPSAPSALPTLSPQPLTSKKSLDFESDISSRLAALKGLSTNDLGLPSAPSFKPSDKPIKGVIKKPTYTDEEIDTWCVICQDDATVKCVGCEGDLYCAACWKEGHMGPGVGMEERTHKWARYRKPN